MTRVSGLEVSLEIWISVLKGLNMAWQLDYHLVILDSNSKATMGAFLMTTLRT